MGRGISHLSAQTPCSDDTSPKPSNALTWQRTCACLLEWTQLARSRLCSSGCCAWSCASFCGKDGDTVEMAHAVECARDKSKSSTNIDTKQTENHERQSLLEQ
eukprot:552587-Amphidinium_carterae.1